MAAKRKLSSRVPSIDSGLLLPYLDSLHQQLSGNIIASNDDNNGTTTITVASIETQTDVVITIENEEGEGNTYYRHFQTEKKKNGGYKDQQQDDNEKVFCYKPSSYLKDHLDLMYYLALYRKTEKQFSFKSVFQLVAFVMTTILSWIQGLGDTKQYVLKYAKRGSVYHYITVWYYLHSVLVSLYFLKLVVSNKISSFLSNSMGDTKNNKDVSNTSSGKGKLVIVLAIASILSSGYDAVGFPFLIGGSEFKEVIEVKSIRIRKTFLIWSKENYTDYFENLAEEILGTGYTASNVVLEFTEILLEYFGWLQYYMIRDIMLMAALTLYTHAEVYKAFLKSVGTFDSSTIGKMWDSYNILYKLSNEMEECFGSLFKLVHIDNWLFCAYFMLNSLEEDTKIDANFVTNLALVAKVIATYCLAALANNVGTQFKRRLNSLSMSSIQASNADATEIKISKIYLEQQINNSPVGLGSGNFLITENYAYKFIGSVVSSFLFFIDSERKSESS